MNRYIPLLVISISLTLSPALYAQPLPAQPAESVKTIILTDGTKIKGKILSLQNGTYTVQTTQFGNVEIKDEQVVTISSQDTPLSIEPQSGPTGADLKSRIAGLQTQVLADPEIMVDLQELMQDPEMLQMLSDPSFVSAITSYDVQQIKNHPQAQKLLTNPKMLNLIQKINQKQGNAPLQ